MFDFVHPGYTRLNKTDISKFGTGVSELPNGNVPGVPFKCDVEV